MPPVGFPTSAGRKSGWYAFDARERDLKRRALSELGVDPDVPSALLHDTVDRRQAEAGMCRLVFGREEWLKNVLLYLLIDPGFGIVNSQHYVTAGWNGNTRGDRVHVFQLYICSLDPKLAPLGHRVSRVDSETQQDLFDSGHVRLHCPEIL